MSIWEFDQELHDQAMREDGEVIGLEKGEFRKLISQVCKKKELGQTPEKIAEDLVEKISVIELIYKVANESAPEYDVEQIYMRLTAAEQA